MKKKIFNRILTVVLALVLLISMYCLTAVESFAAKKPLEYPAKKEEKDWIEKGTEKLKSVETLDKAVSGTLKEIYEGNKEGNSAGEIAYDMITAAVNAVASAYGLGGISDLAFSLIDPFKDDTPPAMSEIEVLSKQLNDQFAEVSKDIDDVRFEVIALSERMDESTAEIINALKDVQDDSYARDQVILFMTSTDGNFNYKQFKNYLFGSVDASENEYYYNQAYKTILDNSLLPNSGASDKVIEDNYKTLYRSLMSTSQHGDSNVNMFYDYLFYNETTGKESIQHYYYDYLLSNSKLLDGKNPEYEALMFTIELYITTLEINHAIRSCENYFLVKMFEEYGFGVNPSIIYYSYGSGDDDRISMQQIFDSNSALEKRQAELEKQLAQDIAYILNMAKSVTIKEADGKYRTMCDDEAATFGKVVKGETVYLNQIEDLYIDACGLDKDLLSYVFISDSDSKLLSEEGFLLVDENVSGSFTGKLLYDGKELFKISFKVNDFSGFSGGSGTEEDPYIIASPEQFKKIKYGLDKHYRLIADLDFKGVSFETIGSDAKHGQFTGSLDGDGYKIKNLSFSGANKAAIFACIGKSTDSVGNIKQTGVVKNLFIENSTVEITNRASYSNRVAMIAGQNFGTIYNCHINSCTIKLEIEFGEWHIGTQISGFTGGIAGTNEAGAVISYCSVKNSTLICDQKRNYSSNPDSSNGLLAHIAGITGASSGYINNCIVTGTSLTANNHSECKADQNRHPIIVIYISGIVGWNSDSKNVEKIYYEVTENPNPTCHNADTSEWHVLWKEDAHTAKVSGGINRDHIGKIDAKKEDIVFPSVRPSYDFTYYYADDFNAEYNCSNGLLYDYAEPNLKTENLILLANGESVSYAVLGYYGFDTINDNKISVKKCNVTVLFCALVNDQVVISQIQIPIVVKENKISEIVIDKVQTVFDKDEQMSLSETKITVYYQDGTSEDITQKAEFDIDTGSYGKKTVTVSYLGVSVGYEITVTCDEHNYEEKVIAPTCTYWGYTILVCSKCGDEQFKTGSIQRMTEHNTKLEGYIPATCTSKGYSGVEICLDCGKKVSQGTETPKALHTYVSSGTGHHTCSVCDKSAEPHEFTATENTDKIIYSCILCGYKCEEARKADKLTPRVDISDAYALTDGSKFVTVYVQILNNPGITGASFSINYDSRLEFVKFEKCDVLTASVVSLNHDTDRSAFIVTMARAEVDKTSGNLLKLVFRAPDDRVFGDEYNISISYSRSGSKFSNEYNEPIDIITSDGGIKIVDHLPGDVNNDKSTDLLDAVLIARYLSEYDDEVFNKVYADIDLNGIIEIYDLTRLLQYLVGGYGAEALSNKFDIILNTNDGSVQFDKIDVQYYDDNGNPGTVHKDLPTPQRDGYTFTGWYTELVGGVLVENGSPISYNKEQTKQTLYAHYELNQLVFNGNGSTSGEMANVDYFTNESEIYTFANGYIKEIYVTFNSNCDEIQNTKTKVIYEFIGWSLVPDGEVIFKLGDTINLKTLEEISADRRGRVELYAIWSTESVELPSLERFGWEFYGWTFEQDGGATAGNAHDAYYVKSEDATQTSDGLTVKLYANWLLIQYKINYDGNGATSGETHYPGYYSLNTKQNLEKNGFERVGYKFVEWNTEADGTGLSYKEEAYVWGIPVERNGDTVSLYAQWTPIVYNITYSSNIKVENLNPSTYTIETSDINLVDLSADGWKFEGWYSGDKQVTSILNGSIGDLSLTAVWSLIEYKISYTNTKDAENTNITSYTITDETVVLSNISKEGYIFKGWYLGTSKITEIKKGSFGDLTLEANWTPISYNICYNANGGEGNMDSETVLYDVQHILLNNAFTRTGYKFDGWNTKPDGSGASYTDGASVMNLTEVSGADFTLYAQWDVNTYTIIFNSNKPATATSEIQGFMNDLTAVIYDERITLTNKFTLKDWYFLGWSDCADGTPLYNDGEIVSKLSAEDCGEIELFAIWVQDFYIVNYDANKPDCSCEIVGTMIESKCMFNVSFDLRANEYKIIGHEFKGWSTEKDGTVEYSDGEKVFNLTDKGGATITLFAVWDVVEYTISYEENGGKEIGDVIYNVHDISSVVIPDAIYDNSYSEYYNFEGWYFDKALTQKFDKVALKADPENITLYAEWDECVVYSDIATTPNITEERVIIDWSNTDGTNIGSIRGNSVLSIANTVKEVIIIGNRNLTFTNMSISLNEFAKDQEITLRLVDFKFISNVNGAISINGADKGVDLTIDINGTCSVATSATGANAISGFANIVRFTGNGDINITAGNGSTGGVGIASANIIFDMKGNVSVRGGDGNIAGNAISVSETLTLTNSVVINAYGGNGTDGANGACAKKNGTDQGHGEDGSRGTNGAIAIQANSIIIYDGTLNSTGGSGGAGGMGGCCNPNAFAWSGNWYGGDGGTGGTGGLGINANSIIVENGALISNGGSGGNGGSAGGIYAGSDGTKHGHNGNFGSGGAGGVAINSNCSITGDCTKNNGKNGNTSTVVDCAGH